MVIAVTEKQVWLNMKGRTSLVSIDKVREYKSGSSKPGEQTILFASAEHRFARVPR